MECDLQATIYHRVLPDIKAQLVELYEQGDGIARWMPSQVHLQRGDVFPALAAGQSVNFWITFHADSKTRPGIHPGLIRITPADQAATKLPLEIRVRDFQLQRPRAAFGMFFREDMLPRRFGGLDTPHKLVLAMYRDMAEHGHNAGWFYPAATFANLPPTNSPALEKLLPLAQAAGLLDPAIPSMICGGIPGDLDAPQLRAAGRWLNHKRQEQGWPELVVFGTDEPAYPRDAAIVRKQLQQLRGLPLRVNVDLDATAAYGYGDLCDVLTVMDGELSAEMQREAQRRGTRIWTYSYRIWRKDLSPLRQRFYAGFYTWTHRLGGNWVWAYHHAHHRHAWFAPQDPRPHPVTGYEARREGIDDYRYLQMLEDAIAKIKSGELEGVIDDDGQWAPQINLGVPVLIPEDYVPDLDVRLGLYRRLSELTTKVELEGFAAELIDRFGKLPKEVNTLMLVVRIKAMCKRAGIAKLDGGPKGVTIQFHNDKFASPEGLVTFIQDQRGLAKVKENKIVVKRDWKTDADKIKGAFAIARDLAEHVISKEKKAKKAKA